ncbi:piggyBac transposable element-derived protein 3-like [Hyalella azteca]|uniref:PiggyBac transposable element-derived protein 3-like n=1 Tax=Hyalella azteca TaxID=294128 RepID=A0A8B7P428_HYAAZ|nr:piggyBac transposable element-derived protein 3-like [Hyalella azteca]
MSYEQPGPSRSNTEHLTEYEKVQKRSAIRQGRKFLTLDEAVKMVLCPDGDKSDEDDEEFESAVYDDIEEEDTIQHICTLPNIEVHDGASEDDIPLSIMAEQQRAAKNVINEFIWSKKDFSPPNDIEWKDRLIVDEEWQTFSATSFFNLIFDDALIDFIVQQTKLHALQKDGKEMRLENTDMKCFLGILLLTGIIKVPSYRTYWKKGLQLAAISDIMSRDKFEEIKRYIHFNDNTQQKTRDDPDFDKLFKIRPIIESIRTNCRKVSQEEHQVVDEQIIPTKARISLKQYNPKKPHKWGYKVISQAGSSGFVYDFEIYTGKSQKNDDLGVGVSSAYVLRLAEGIPKHLNYKLFYDNWFSSVDLSSKLKESGILNVSTVRANRLKGCIMENDKKLQKEGRGSFDYRVETNRDVIAVKWFDNKSVHLLSTYAGITPEDTVKRWDKKRNKHIEINRPFVVKEYNKFMGGVDLCDMLIELYRIDFKSKKWYMRIFLYLLDMSVVNSWLLYKRNCHVMKSKVKSLSDFKEDLAIGLMSPSSTPRGRPSHVNGASTS